MNYCFQMVNQTFSEHSLLILICKSDLNNLENAENLDHLEMFDISFVNYVFYYVPSVKSVFCSAMFRHALSSDAGEKVDCQDKKNAHSTSTHETVSLSATDAS